jgi:hypothetical protein
VGSRARIAFCLVFVATAANAEVILHLEGGRTLRGEVITQDRHSLRFRTRPGITVTLKPAEILRIEPVEDQAPVRPRVVTRPAPGKPAPRSPEHSKTCPLDCPLCERMFGYSLDSYCAEVIRRPAVSPIPVRLGAWPALQVPACSVLGLVLLGEPGAKQPGVRRRTLLRLTRYVSTWSRREHPSLRAHRTWTVALSTLFLAEMHRTAPSAALKGKIHRLVRLLESGRHGREGWCHTLERTGYGPFVAVTIWSAAGLAAAREQGVPVDADGLKATFAGLRGCIARSGGASYYTRRGTTLAVGRTGGVLWALRRYAGDDGDEVRRGLGFLLRHVENAPHGHASGVMNFAWGALGASSSGPAAHKTFWAAHRKTLLAARKPDGRFAVQPWKDLGYVDYRHEPKPPREAQGTTWPDRMYGDGWATVWMLLAWQVGRGRCVLARTARGPGMPAPRDARVGREPGGGR